ncbi:BamA/TamA family outer membrane protein [Rubrolithibacter danxiaensis]|uniref:translocation and assembly module lipoprotein TamL n=1 Tax=Rubrolithibacter danxiaensis TaxID=3390805 RepID=UPI003BF7FDD1
MKNEKPEEKRMKMGKKNILYFLIFLAFGYASCNITKRVPKGDLLYIGGKVKIEDKDIKHKEAKSLEADLTSLLRPKPNSTILGLRPKLWLYNISGNSNKGLGKLLKKFAEPPVLFSTVKVDFNRDLVANRLENRGYFRSAVTADTVIRRRKAKLIYHAQAGPQYLINAVNFSVDSSDLGRSIQSVAGETFLKPGDGYNLDIIKAERERIDSRLKEKGFYFFNPDNILVQVDSTDEEHKVNLYVTIKESTPQKSKDVYRINDIYIFPNFRPRDTAQNMQEKIERYQDFKIIDPRNTFKPKVFGRTMFFNKGDVYNRTDHNLSLNRLVTLGTFRFVKNQFEEVESLDSPRLDAYYYLTPYPKKSLRAEITGRTNSANFTGSEITLSWKNRNAFKGAELVTVSAYGGTDVQVSGVNKGNNIYRLGGEINFNIPRFVGFNFKSSSAYLPRTKFTLGYDLLRRVNSYTLNSFRTSAGYNWKQNSQREHQLDIIAVNYVQPSNVSEEYKTKALSDPIYRNAIQRQFTIGSIYNFNYTNTNETYKTNTWYFNGNLDLSGNLLGLLTGADIINGKQKKLFGAPFAQYIRLETDLRYYRKLGSNSRWANRILVGYGYTYGNGNGAGGLKGIDPISTPLSLPYVKQFFIGGTNSIRAFRARTLGPGTNPPENVGTRSLSADQSGDIKLELNTEYRPKLFSIVEGALFIDAGNIWLLHDDPDRPGAAISKDFLKELAVGTGAGLRFDLSFLVLRTDLSFPLRKPWLPQGQRWVLDDIDFGSKSWRKENLVFNLAIGYPF